MRCRTATIHAARYHPAMLNPYDLFGEVAITDNDLYLWVAAVSPRWLSPPRSYALYLKSWHVADKVRAAKIAGSFDRIVQRKSAVFNPRLAIDLIV